MPLPLALPRYVCAGLILFVYSAAISQTTPTLQVEARRNHKEAWKSYPTRTTDQLAGFVSKSVPPRLDQYGGLADDKSSATGFFRTEKRGGRWWLIDPEGGKFLHVGVASVRSGNTSASQTSWTEKFGSAEKWAEATNALLRVHGFNGTGAWSDTKFLQTAPQKVAYTLNWNFMSSYGAARGGTYQLPGHTGYPGNCIFVFDPEFEAFCGQHAKKLAETKNDPWLLGHFSDNEMPLDLNMLDRFLGLPAQDHGHQAAQMWLQEQRKKTKMSDNATTVTDEQRSAFLVFAVDRYFRIVSQAIKAVDPNHLYLGARLHGAALRLAEIYQGAGPYVDINSVNYYNAWTPSGDRLALWEHESTKPCIITEFYVKGMDSGLGNTTGAGWDVRTQKDRGYFYQNFVLGLLESRTCVGWHWFRYMDNDPLDKKNDASNQDSNKGIVTVRHEPYTALLTAMNDLNRHAYSLATYFDRQQTTAEPTTTRE